MYTFINPTYFLICNQFEMEIFYLLFIWSVKHYTRCYVIHPRPYYSKYDTANNYCRIRDDSSFGTPAKDYFILFLIDFDKLQNVKKII